MRRTIAAITAAIGSLLPPHHANAETLEVHGQAIDDCTAIVGRWRHDSWPFIEVDLTITGPDCRFKVIAGNPLRQKRHEGKGHTSDGILVLPLKEHGKDVGHFLLRKRPHNLGGWVRYDGDRRIELWWTDSFPKGDR
jgi:hypothetical protein